MRNAAILLVEDNDDDVALTLRAFKKNNINLTEAMAGRVSTAPSPLPPEGATK